MKEPIILDFKDCQGLKLLNINKVTLASEASQENFEIIGVLAIKYE